MLQRGPVPVARAALGRLGDEDHVHVAGVVELAPAALAHRDHGQPARRRPGRQLRAGDRERRLQRRRRQVGQLGGHVVDRHLAGEVPGRQVQQPLAVGHPQRGGRAGSGPAAPGRRHRLRGAGIRAHGGQQRGAQLPGGRAGQRLRAAQEPPAFRVPGQVVAERGAGPEHQGQPPGQVGVLVQGGEQLGVPGHPGQGREREIRVGRGGERRQQPGVAGVEVEREIPARQPLGLGGVGEPHSGQPGAQRGPARHAHALHGSGPRRRGARRAPGRGGGCRQTGTEAVRTRARRPGRARAVLNSRAGR